jgi:DNA-binding XRE family transcriptional regulator
MPYGPTMAMLPGMLEHERTRAGWSTGRAAWELGVSIGEYRELEAGERSPNWETFDRICKLYGWPQTFVAVL